jgi:predicted ATPase
MKEGLAAINVTGTGVSLPYFLALLGEALAKAGRPDAGLVEIDRAIATAHERGQGFQLSEVLRLKGELLVLLSKSRRREAEACMREAIDVADKQGAKLPKLQAAMSCAKLLVSEGEAAQARALLKPAYDAITEGRELADLRAAAAMLAQLPGR